MPYGPIVKVVPYLIRRAQENSAMLGEAAGRGVVEESIVELVAHACIGEGVPLCSRL